MGVLQPQHFFMGKTTIRSSSCLHWFLFDFYWSHQFFYTLARFLHAFELLIVGFIYICTKGFKGWCKLKFVSQLSAFFSFLYLFGAFSGLKVFIGDCWVLFSNVGSYSLFPKFRMIYHCVFLRFLFVACRCSTKFII